MPDLSRAEKAFPLFIQQDYEAKYITQLDGVYQQSLSLEELIDRARRAAVEHAEYLMHLEAGLTVGYVVLDLPCTFFMLQTTRYENLANFILHLTCSAKALYQHAARRLQPWQQRRWSFQSSSRGWQTL